MPLEHVNDRLAVLAFAHELLDDQQDEPLSAVTIDVGWAVDAERRDEGWAVVEANMACVGNIYDFDPAGHSTSSCDPLAACGTVRPW